MLRKYKTLLLILSCFAIFTACEKEYSVENGVPGGGIGGGGQPTPGTFRAKIDGVQWSANRIKSATKMAGVIAITGTNSDGKMILLRVADSGVHNYTITNTSTTNIGTFTDSSIAPVAALTTNQWFTDSTYGTMNITTIDSVRKTMSGTFKINVFRSLDGIKRNITEGVFTDISYGVALPPPSSSDSFTVKVDGTEFIETSFTGISSMGYINFVANNAAGATVGITLSDAITPGTYPMSIAGDAYGQYNPNSSTFLISNPGTLTILEHNTTTHRIRATFSFTAASVLGGGTPVQMTAGYLSGSYQ